MTKHRFMLVLSGVSEITPELADVLYVATGGDIEWGQFDDTRRIAGKNFNRAAGWIAGST